MPIRTRNAVGLLAAAALLGCDPERTTVPTMQGSSAVAQGNGLPDNGHDRRYKFNLIGVPRDKNPDMTGDWQANVREARSAVEDLSPGG